MLNAPSDLEWSQAPGGTGEWTIRFGTSKFLLCEGPGNTLDFGEELFKELTGDYPALIENEFASGKRFARWRPELITS